MAPLRHFITGDFEKRTVFLPDKEYGLALDALVKGCADVLITSGAGPSLRILLGKRRVEPQPDWWFVGGRTRPGDTITRPSGREQIAAAHAQINTLEGTVGALKARVATAEEHGGIQREELRMRVEQVSTTAGSDAPTHAASLSSLYPTSDPVCSSHPLCSTGCSRRSSARRRMRWWRRRRRCRRRRRMRRR